MTVIIFFYFAFLLSTILVPVNIYLGRKVGIVDKPDPRKVHKALIPRTGGVAIALSVFLPLLLTHFKSSLVLGYTAGAFCIVGFGLVDDFKNINYRYKFLGQISAALIFVLISGLTAETMGELWPGLTVPTGPMAVPLTVFFLVAVINVINLSDGLDGLAGGLTLLSLLGCGALAGMQGEYVLQVLSTAILGALIGFLRHNIHPASVFMGDTGSQFLGFSLGVILLSVTQGHSIYSPVLPLFILGTPILDTALVMYERISQGLSPFKPDKRHLHHKILQFGFSHEQAVTVIYVFHFLLILLGWSMRFGPDFMVLAAYVVLFAGAFALRVASGEKQRRIKGWLEILAGKILSLRSRSKIPWSRYHVSRFCWRSFFLLFAASYFILPLHSFGVHPLIGWGSLPLAAGLFGFIIRSKGFPVNTVRVAFYLITLYAVIIKGYNPMPVPVFGQDIPAGSLLFFLITVFYFLCLLLTPEEPPLNSISYLLMGLAVFVALVPVQGGQGRLLQHVMSTSIFYGLYINLIFSRIQRNKAYVLVLTGFSLSVIFFKFLAG